jgi:L-threonylcarbamoyladenylate synthase
VRHALGSRVGMILDGGRCPGGIPSTVVDVTVSPAVIRRRGAMVAQVEELIAQMS